MGKNNKTQFGMLMGLLAVSMFAPDEKAYSYSDANKAAADFAAKRPQCAMPNLARTFYIFKGEPTHDREINEDEQKRGKEYDQKDWLFSRYFAEVGTTGQMAISVIALIIIGAGVWFMPNAFHSVSTWTTSFAARNALALTLSGGFLFLGIRAGITRFSK